MSKLLGGPLRMQNQYKLNDKPGPSTDFKRTYLCRKCSVSFKHYPGIKVVNSSGIGLCKEHNPDYKEPVK